MHEVYGLRPTFFFPFLSFYLFIFVFSFLNPLFNFMRNVMLMI